MQHFLFGSFSFVAATAHVGKNSSLTYTAFIWIIKQCSSRRLFQIFPRNFRKYEFNHRLAPLSGIFHLCQFSFLHLLVCPKFFLGNSWLHTSFFHAQFRFFTFSTLITLAVLFVLAIPLIKANFRRQSSSSHSLKNKNICCSSIFSLHAG